MSDIRDILRGLDETHRAVYIETRTNMRRAYLAAHAAILPISQYDQSDDRFLDFIDLSIAMLFDRAGTFNHIEGKLDSETTKAIGTAIQNDGDSAATRMLKQNGQAWPQKVN